MTWTRFDDAARSHPKAILAGNEAWGFWAAAVMYCNQFNTDGFLSDSVLSMVPPTPISKSKAKKLADRLCDAKILQDGSGLFERDNERGGYIVHDFLKWNPSKKQTEERRKRDRLRKESARNPDGQRQESTATDAGQKSDSSHACPAGVGARAPSPAQPSPAQPEDPPVGPPGDANERWGLSSVDERKTKRGRKRTPAHPLPESWHPNDAHRSESATLGIDVEDQERRMRDWALESDARKCDWDAAFRNWLRRTADRMPRRGNGAYRGATAEDL